MSRHLQEMSELVLERRSFSYTGLPADEGELHQGLTVVMGILATRPLETHTSYLVRTLLVRHSHYYVLYASTLTHYSIDIYIHLYLFTYS